MSGEQASDSTFTIQQELKLEYNQVMDTLISQISWRFEALSNIANDFEFLSGFHLNTLSIEDLKKHAANLVLKYSSDLNSELLNEIECFKYQGEAIIPNLKMATYLDILNGIKTYELSSVYPNLVIAYRLLLTFPVTVASGERSFSKLKLIKTYLRSTMTQERLSNLAILSIENKITQTINFDDVIENFASIKSRKISL
ncbi:52 kDa repressor of the inhibitor of the protein kinase-like [Metopolophium dirhodum]|uniref:52 kDa repressor of the inhibitor of the protein kinase-like n=1 Tax=Metopolophium dirhodum TaxID=44670 RepID=UPI00299045D5|nr:52 kDa repressor of the inhibitor of the protein kinase-like [Metopolophium dirhodum]